MAIGIRKKKDRPLYDRMLPEEQAVLDAPMPMDEPAAMRIGVPYLQGALDDPGIDAEAAARQAMGVTSQQGRYGAPPGMIMRNEAGRGTPLIRSDRPYWAPGMMAAAPEVAPVDDPELMARLEAQQQESLGVMDGKRMMSGGENSPDVEARRKEYMASTNLADLRAKRIGIQKERQAAVTEKAKDRRMTPQQRANKQFVQSVDSDGDGFVDPIVGGVMGGVPGYAAAAQAKNAATENANRLAEAEAARKFSAEQNELNRQNELAKAGVMAGGRGKDVIGPAVAGGMPIELATRISGNMETGQPMPNVPIANKASEAFLNSTTPEQFLQKVPVDVLMRNQEIAKAFGPQLLQQYGAPAMLKALGGEFEPYRGSMNYEQQLAVNQQNLLRKLLGLPGFKPTPEDEFGQFGGLLSSFARGATGSGF